MRPLDLSKIVPADPATWQHLRTRGGKEIRIYAIEKTIHGAYLDGDNWCVVAWDRNGRQSQFYKGSLDIVDPRHGVARWYFEAPEDATPVVLLPNPGATYYKHESGPSYGGVDIGCTRVTPTKGEPSDA